MASSDYIGGGEGRGGGGGAWAPMAPPLDPPLMPYIMYLWNLLINCVHLLAMAIPMYCEDKIGLVLSMFLMILGERYENSMTFPPDP